MSAPRREDHVAKRLVVTVDLDPEVFHRRVTVKAARGMLAEAISEALSRRPFRATGEIGLAGPSADPRGHHHVIGRFAFTERAVRKGKP